MHLEDIEIRCGDGWVPILERMLDEISQADAKVTGLVAEERNGHLSIDYAHAEPWLAVAKVFFLAECRSYYVCETCGRPGEHRGDGPIWRATRCAEHRAPNPGGTCMTVSGRRGVGCQMATGPMTSTPTH